VKGIPSFPLILKASLWYQDMKKPAPGGFFHVERESGLLDLGFLVDHVFADHGIVFFDFHFVRHGALVLGRSVVMASVSAGDEFDFVTHDFAPLDLFTAVTHIRQDSVDAFLVDDAHALAANAQTHPALLRFDPEAVAVQVGQKPPPGFVVRVRHIVPAHRAFTGNLTYSRHN